MNKPKCSVKEALEEVRKNIKRMTPDQVRVELAKHTKGEFAQSMRETAEFLARRNKE